MYIVRGRYVVTVDAAMNVLRDGAVVVDGDTVVDLGPFKEMTRLYRCDVVGDEWKIVLPGLVNCHYHSREQLAATLFPDGLPEPIWFPNYCLRYHEVLSPEEEKLAFKLALYSMALNGITLFSDGGLLFPEKTLEALNEIPLRCLASTWCWDIPDTIHKTFDEAFEEIVRFKEKFDGGYGGLLGVCATPINVHTCSEKLLKKIVEWARENHVKTLIHVSSFREEVEKSYEKWKVSPVEYLFQRGLLNADVNILHSVHLSHSDVDLVAGSGAGAVCCPFSSMKKGKGLAVNGKFPELLRKGVRVGIGGDGAPSSQHVDFFRAAGVFAGLFRDARTNASAITSVEALRAITSTGADLLGLSKRVGSIEKGKKADLILLDIRRPEFLPLTDVHQSLVFSATGSAVDTVIVNGRMVVEHGVIPGLNFKSLFKDAEKAVEKVAEKMGLQIPM